MFQFPGFALNPYVFRAQYLLLTIRSPTPSGRPAGVGIRIVEGGFPHSEILGSKLVRSSPRLIAAYHVLHRLSAPRHPPNALVTLDHSHDRWPPLTLARRRPIQRSPPGLGAPAAIGKTCLWNSHSKDVCLPNASSPHPLRGTCRPQDPKIPEPATCITSLRCQTPAIAPVFRNHHELQKSQPNTQASTPQGETTTPHATRSQPRTSKTPKKNGGARRDRTDDLKLAKLPLSQLSYGPPWQSQGVFDPLASSAGADVRPLRLSAPRGAAAIRPGGADAPKNGACA